MAATPSTTLTPNDIEIATRAADHFTRIYYTAYDSDTRLADLPPFYRANSSLTWNGTPFQGVEGLKDLVTKMPATKHEVQSFDCHPIPGAQPPSLLITVSGNVIHGKGPSGNPPDTPARAIEGHPRVFSQTFILVPDPNAPPTKPGEVAKYYVSADALRFVG
ncbi:Nuclear transport factor 2 [Psilocybe cubensis]|uniref:Nuclear transport factor 2 n=2 Tax=Psilocybe cubensis TaxID=181762 RepID=A0ACB8HEF3_PSICU|nr:Nuclear transport factor 2 [Psilocybe cubensis]KAH9486306.1 Nuclear transport factor 2 [Psilocybe cubensis]